MLPHILQLQELFERLNYIEIRLITIDLDIFIEEEKN